MIAINSKIIFGIDPGPVQSAIVILNAENKKIIEAGKYNNLVVGNTISRYLTNSTAVAAVIELVQPFGAPIGYSTMYTLIAIGKFIDRFETFSIEPLTIPRKSIVNFHAGTSRANDSAVKNALLPKYAKHPHKNYGKGTVKEPDYFYGFSKDVWQAFAAAALFYEDQNMAKMLAKGVTDADIIKFTNKKKK